MILEANPKHDARSLWLVAWAPSGPVAPRLEPVASSLQPSACGLQPAACSLQPMETFCVYWCWHGDPLEAFHSHGLENHRVFKATSKITIDCSLVSSILIDVCINFIDVHLFSWNLLIFSYVLMENHRSEREPTGSTNLTSGAVNFWKMEGAQKVAFSVRSLSSQIHFRNQLWPGGHFGGILSLPEMQIWMSHAGEIES